MNNGKERGPDTESISLNISRKIVRRALGGAKMTLGALCLMQGSALVFSGNLLAVGAIMLGTILVNNGFLEFQSGKKYSVLPTEK